MFQMSGRTVNRSKHVYIYLTAPSIIFYMPEHVDRVDTRLSGVNDMFDPNSSQTAAKLTDTEK
jgi:hypothetical protein